MHDEQKNLIPELIEDIKERIIRIVGENKGEPVYLYDVSFPDDKQHKNNGYIIGVNCIFIHDESIRADLYRSKSDDNTDFICGISLSNIGEHGLSEVISAIDEGRYSIMDDAVLHKQKKTILSSIKFPFALKGA